MDPFDVVVHFADFSLLHGEMGVSPPPSNHVEEQSQESVAGIQPTPLDADPKRATRNDVGPLSKDFHDAPGGTRTHDRRFRRPLLCPSELQAQGPEGLVISEPITNQRSDVSRRRRVRGRVVGVVGDAVDLIDDLLG